jgi:dUTP pyrophosphatase
MDMVEKISVKKIVANAKMPEKAHNSDSGYDVYAISEQEVAPNVWAYGIGIGVQYEERNFPLFVKGMQFRARSSVWKTGMVLSNGVGTVDEGYTGEIKAVFYHVMPEMPRYKVGDKIGQLVPEAVDRLEFVEVPELQDTDRNANGFGSTDKINN